MEGASRFLSTNSEWQGPAIGTDNTARPVLSTPVQHKLVTPGLASDGSDPDAVLSTLKADQIARRTAEFDPDQGDGDIRGAVFFGIAPLD